MMTGDGSCGNNHPFADILGGHGGLLGLLQDHCGSGESACKDNSLFKTLFDHADHGHGCCNKSEGSNPIFGALGGCPMMDMFKNVCNHPVLKAASGLGCAVKEYLSEHKEFIQPAMDLLIVQLLVTKELLAKVCKNKEYAAANKPLIKLMIFKIFATKMALIKILMLSKLGK